MSDKKYSAIGGMVQHFPDQELVTETELSGQIVRKIKVKSITSGNIVSIDLWPEWPDVKVKKGSFIVADGSVRTSTGKQGGTFVSLNPYSLNIDGQVIEKTEREVVNAETDDSPVVL